MGTEANIPALLAKYEQGSCTPEELAVLEQWFQDLGKGSLPAPAGAAAMKEEAWAHITAEMEAAEAPPVRAPLLQIKRLAMAAALIGLVVLGAFAYLHARPGEMVMLQTSVGETEEVALPDGSSLVLQPATKVQYPARFAENRTVHLTEGAAAFSVKHDPAHPFVVHTPSGISTRVLGTRFTVAWYAAKPKAKVTVASGKVQVGSKGKAFGVLTANEELEVDKAGSAYVIRNLNQLPAAALQQKVVLEDVSFTELAQSLERSFHKPVAIASKGLANCRISITYTPEDKLEKILRDISRIYTIKITNDEKGISLSGKGCTQKTSVRANEH